MSGERIALRYMTRFRCIAERCEDTCCVGWKISLDRASHERLAGAMGGTPDGKLRLAECVSLNPRGGAGSDFAQIKNREDGSCSFLDSDRLCSIQRGHGEGLLSNLCATFPRVLSQVGPRLELAGALSCPEAARLCLLQDDAVDLVDLDLSILPRRHAKAMLQPSRADPYSYYFDDLRAAMLRLVGRRRFPLAARLVFLAHFAQKVGVLLSEGCSWIPSLWEENERRLATEVESMERTEVLDEVARQFGAIDVQTSLLPTLAAVIQARMGLPHTPRFATLVRGIVRTYREAAGLSPENPSETFPSVDLLWSAYRMRRDALDAAAGPRVEQYFRNYAMQYWIREWYTSSPSLLAHVYRLQIRIGVLRLMLLGHPEVCAVLAQSSLAGGPPVRIGATEQEAIDRAAVELFQLFAKNMEQSPEFSRVLTEAFDTSGTHSFAQSILLAKLF
jgi:lysine-N-methylase